MRCLWLLGGLLLLACGRSEAKPASTRAPQAKEAPGKVVPAKPAPSKPAQVGPEARGEGYVWRASQLGEVHAGRAATVVLQLTTTPPWHINEEYPLQIDASAPAAIKLGKAHLEKADAKLFLQEKAVFELPATAPAGQHTVAFSLSFAVCTDQNCVPDEQKLALTLNVQP